MTPTRDVESYTRWGLVAAAGAVLALVLAMFPTAAPAAVNCAAPVAGADSDQDGFSDVEECNAVGITLPGALGGATYPKCTFAPGENRANCVDPDSKDVFVIVVAASPSLLPANPLELLSQLPAGVHPIIVTAVPASRAVTLTQNAILLVESRDTNGDTAGQCNWQTPNGGGVCTVFSLRIVNFVNTQYAGCQPGASAATIQSTIDTYLRQVTAHEPSHSMKLTKLNDPKIAHHYRQGSNAMMASAVSYSCKGGTLTWTIGTPYTDADKADFLLK